MRDSYGQSHLDFMDSNAVTSGLWDPSDLSHTKVGVGQQAVWGAEVSAPLSTSESWYCPPSQCVGISVDHRQRATIGTYQAPEYPLPTENLDQSSLVGLRHQSQSRHEPVMSYTDCSNAFCEVSVVPSGFFLGHSPPPEGVNLSTCGGRELFSAGLRNTHQDVRVPASPSLEEVTFSIPEYYGVMQRPPAQFLGYALSPTGPGVEMLGRRSVGSSQDFLSPDVCAERSLGPLDNHNCPGTELPVDLLRSKVRPLGSTSVIPTSNSTGLVGAPTEQCPSRAYPPRQGTGYVPLRFSGGPMTDAITTSARSRIASPSLDEQTLSSVPSSKLCRSFDDSWIFRSSGESLTNVTPLLDPTLSRRHASTPNLSAEGLNDSAAQECVFDSRMNLVQPRKRRPFSASEREETRTVRVKGACGACRKSKRRVTMLCSMMEPPS